MCSTPAAVACPSRSGCPATDSPPEQRQIDVRGWHRFAPVADRFDADLLQRVVGEHALVDLGTGTGNVFVVSGFQTLSLYQSDRDPVRDGTAARRSKRA